MRTAFLGLGSNIDAEANIKSAIESLRRDFGQVGLSPVYRCPAVGFQGPDFVNLVARIETGLGPLELKNYLTGLENEHLRARNVAKFSDRTLDIDILLYDDLWVFSPQLQIPRDEILEAAYVLRPLAELAPGRVHPVAHRTLAELWDRFPAEEVELVPLQL